MDSSDKKTLESKAEKISKIPTRLKKGFNRNLNSTCSTKDVEIKREAILQERTAKLNTQLLKVKKKAQEIKECREKQRAALLKSMALAENNRNFHIEQRRATSKRIVEKAKSVVIQNKHRRQEEQERRRAELENRILKTEARRLAHLNRYKQKPNLKSPKKKEESPVKARKKQKLSGWDILMKRYYGLRMPLPMQSDTWLPFNDLYEKIHNAKTIAVMSKMLNRGLLAIDQQKRNNSRIFLTAYVVLMCPKDVFQHPDSEKEQDLHKAAKDMLETFQRWYSTYNGCEGDEYRLLLQGYWERYNHVFEAWKKQDHKELESNTIDYYVQLSVLRQKMISQQHGGDKSVGDQLQGELDGIKNRLKQLSGPSGLEKLQVALDKVSASTSTGLKKQQESAKPREWNGQNDQTTSLNVDKMLDKYGNKFMTGMRIAHELLLDPKFSLERLANKDVERVRLNNEAHAKLFAWFEEQIKKENVAVYVYEVVSRLRKTLLLLAEDNTKLCKRIQQDIDLDLVRQEANRNIYDLPGVLSYILDTLSTMCAPIRDHQIEMIRGMADNPMAQAKEMFFLMDKMDFDLCTFNLKKIRNEWINVAHTYEQGKFTELLENQVVGLVKTEAWLSKICKKTCEVAAERNPENVQISTRPNYKAIFEEAFMSLIQWPRTLTRDILPETLYLDVARMTEYQNDFQFITIVAVIIMLTRNFGKPTSQTLSSLSVKLFSMLLDKTTTIDSLVSQIERTLGGNIHPKKKEMIRSMVDKTLLHSDKVYSLLSRRVATFIMNTLKTKTFPSKEATASQGLEHVHDNLKALSQRICMLTEYHYKVYVIWYDKIINNALDKHTVRIK